MEEDTPTVIHCSAGENLLRGTEKAGLKIQKSGAGLPESLKENINFKKRK